MPAAYVGDANSLSWNFIGFPLKPNYSTSFLHWISSLSYPYLTTLYIFNSIISCLPKPSPLRFPWIHRGWTPADVVCVYNGMLLSHSVQLSHSVMSDSLQLHGLQHTRLLCPSPIPRTQTNSCLWSWWCLPNHLILCKPLILLPSMFPSIRVFSNGVSFSHQVAEPLVLQL